MSILDNAVAHFTTQRSELSLVEVPEWGKDGVPAKIYYYAAMNLHEKSEIFKYFTGEGANVEGLAVSLIVRARNEDGSKMFGKADRLRLMREVDSDVLARVVTEMGLAVESMEDAEKN